MKKHREYSINDSGQSIPYDTFSTSSAIIWATSSSDSMSLVEFHGLPIEYSDTMIIKDVEDTPMFKKITDKIAEWINTKTYDYDLTNFGAHSAMIASEETLAKVWNSTEEDDAWAHL
jgi:hypothetical protein